MKKLNILLLLCVILFSVNAQAQETQKKQRSNYIDFNVGSARIIGGMQGYGSLADFPDYFSETIAPLHFDIGYRRMINPAVGFKFDFAYDNIKNDKNSKEFQATFYSLRAQGVINLMNLLEARNQIKWLGLNFHAGLGYSTMTLDKSKTPKGDTYDGSNWDNIMNGIAGITFNFKVSDRWAINLDYTTMLLGKVQTQLDGSRGNHGFIDGGISNLSIGASVNVGKNRVNYDWMTMEEAKGTDINDAAGAYDAVLADVMAQMNALKDKLQSLENAQGDLGSSSSIEKLNLLKSFFDEKLVYAFFDFNEDEPNATSNQAFIVALKYLKADPSANIHLTGYADQIGSSDYNKNLGMRRAEKCKAILVELGINPNRITVSSNGEETEYNAKSEGARQLMRTVQFNIK